VKKRNQSALYQHSARQHTTSTADKILAVQPPPKKTAQRAGLVYVTDETPGIRRVRVGKGFRYRTRRGKPLHDQREVWRIKSLVIPPAWEDVWICPDGKGHLQATGRDARGRKQHLYHPDFRAWRDQTKYDRMLVFVESLPLIRRRIARDLRRQDLCREKVTATVIRLLQDTLIRVGNEEYVKQNGSYGLTTLRDRHAKFTSRGVAFQFRGKSGVEHRVSLQDRRLARIVKQCQDLPGQVLFQYLDEHEEVRSIGSAEVNQYLQEQTGLDFTAKDFRTWAGTVLAACALSRCGPCTAAAQGKRNVNAAVAEVAERLGNTKTVCRKCYIHPRIIECYEEGTLVQRLKLPKTNRPLSAQGALSETEKAVLRFLKRG
jgi:DNA topoisomerase I